MSRDNVSQGNKLHQFWNHKLQREQRLAVADDVIKNAY